jgi:hypothetical protein
MKLKQKAHNQRKRCLAGNRRSRSKDSLNAWLKAASDPYPTQRQTEFVGVTVLSFAAASHSLALLALPIYPSLGQMKILLRQTWRRRITMQHGSLAIVNRKEGSAVWQFRWSEKDLHGTRVQRKRVIGSLERYPNEAAARYAVTVLLAEINSGKSRIRTRSITVAQLCDHFEQRELAKDNTWRSHATKKTYQAYLNRWVRPQWREHALDEVRTIQVESWLRRLPLAKSSCAKIRNLMSVLFNHACRYELFDRNPIHLVRQSAKRRRSPTVLMPAEIKALVGNLAIEKERWFSLQYRPVCGRASCLV